MSEVGWPPSEGASVSHLNTTARLCKLVTFLVREARKCTQAKAYFAATVMQAAAFEGMLQAMCCIYPEQVKKTTVYQRKRFRRKRDKALEFMLHELINIAEELGWFPPTRIRYGGRMTDLTEISHNVRELRNLVHPGKWARTASEDDNIQ